MNDLFFNCSNAVKILGKFSLKKIKKRFSDLMLVTLVLTLIFPLLQVTGSRAQGNPVLIRQVRAMESETTGVIHPAGLAFSRRGNAFQVASAQLATSTALDVVRLTPFAENAGSARLAAAIHNPINLVFDNRENRLLLLHRQANQLLEVPANADGSLHPGNMARYDTRSFDLQNPQGMAVDEASGALYILDAKAPRIVKVERASDGSLNGAKTSEINLQSLDLSALRGLALDPVSGHLFMIDPVEHTLYELTQTGKVVSTRDLQPFRLKNPQAMVFAPSGDQTDDPSVVNLYVADSGLLDEQGSTSPALSTIDSQETGKIVEFSLAAPAAPAAANFTSLLIRTIDMSAISPPSPDPSGIAYLPDSNTLLIVDGEVEEVKNRITHFAGANVWELTLSGSKVGTANISKVLPSAAPITNEPTDIALNPVNGHYYVTDDDGKRVFDLNPGADGSIGTADDTWTYFGTLDAGSGDPEGITFNTWNNHIFVVDGTNAEVYEFSPSGLLISQFDVQQYGVADPEAIEFNPDTGTLFVMSSKTSTRIIVETTIAGELLQTINISATNSRVAAGLAYAPASDGSGEKRFYIVDRGIDNDDDPTIIDGKIYEITAPVFGSTPTSTATLTATSTFTLTPSPTITRTASPTSPPPTPSPTFTRTASSTPLPPSLTPTFTVTSSATPLLPSPLPESPTFSDVPFDHMFWSYIEALYEAGITTGCSTNPLKFCPYNNVTRGEMAVFLERAMGNFNPMPNPSGMFADVPYPGQPAFFQSFIEELYNDGITTGCFANPLKYCPQNYVTRAEMAVFIERARGNFNPAPDPAGMFADVPYPGQPAFFQAFIEQFHNDGITTGCAVNPLRFCPQNNVTRQEMAVFITRAFNIPLPTR